MNNVLIMGRVSDIQLRHTQDGTKVTEMLLSFVPNTKSDEPQPCYVKSVGWGKMADTLYQELRDGDECILEGSIHLHTVERPEGFKEKVAEINVYKLHQLNIVTRERLPVPPAPIFEEPDPSDIPF